MKTIPDFQVFQRLANEFDLVPVCRRLLSDTLTPVSAFRLLDDGKTSGCLFESVIGGELVGRYSFVATHPDSRFVAWGEKTEFYSNGEIIKATMPDPTAFIEAKLASRTVATVPDLPPFLVEPLVTLATMLFDLSNTYPMLRKMIADSLILMSRSITNF